MGTQTNQLDTFLTISALLTGYDKLDLLGTGMVETYLNVVNNKNPVPVVAAFFGTVETILDNDDEQIHEDIAEQLMPDGLFAGLAQNIITMWYMGSWMGNIISSQSYIQGLIWRTADAHPPGAQQPGYGSWQNLPLTVK